MLERLKSLPLTIILTILVWMYAEAQFTATREGITISVRIASPTKDLSVQALDPTDSTFKSALPIQITVQGAQSSVEKLYHQSLGTGVLEDDFTNLILVPANPEANAEQSLETVTALNNLPYFKRNGLVVTTASPSRIRLSTETLVTVMRPIAFRAGNAAPNTEVIAIAPATASVTLPKKILAEMGGADRINLYATALSNVADLMPDMPHNVIARVIAEYPGQKHDDSVTLTPAQVAVTLRLPQQHEAAREIQGVRVDVSGPPELLRDNIVDVQPAAVSVTVAGPAAVLEALKGDSIHAFLELAPADHPMTQAQSRPLRFVLPDGIQLRGGDKEVRFQLKARPATTEHE